MPQAPVDNPGTQEDGGWPIVRTRPPPLTPGRALPAFIHNDSYFLTEIEVFADGLVTCWDWVDLGLLATKLAKGWVALRPAAGEQLSIHNLGHATILGAEWATTAADFERRVRNVVRQLNPSGSGLVDLGGSEKNLANNARHRQLTRPNKPYRGRHPDAIVWGREEPIFARDGDLADFRLARWFVYSDGFTQLDSGDLRSVDDVVALVERGDVTTSVPDRSWVAIPGLGRFRTIDGHWNVDPAERIKEIRDHLRSLRGAPNAMSACYQAFQAYESDPSEENRALLRVAYEAVPRHLQRYCCADQDRKDWAIRAVLYPGERAAINEKRRPIVTPDQQIPTLLARLDRDDGLQQSDPWRWEMGTFDFMIAALRDQGLSTLQRANGLRALDVSSTMWRGRKEVLSAILDHATHAEAHVRSTAVALIERELRQAHSLDVQRTIIALEAALVLGIDDEGTAVRARRNLQKLRLQPTRSDPPRP